MESTFDIFEVLTDGTTLWKEAVFGLSAALKKAEALAINSGNEFKVIHIPTHTVVGTWASTLAPPSPPT